MWIIQYRGTSEDWDGHSEYKCIDGCNTRIGRWSGKELKDEELEPRNLRLKKEQDDNR